MITAPHLNSGLRTDWSDHGQAHVPVAGSQTQSYLVRVIKVIYYIIVRRTRER